MTGTIIRGVSGQYTVLSDRGVDIQRESICIARGRFRNDGEKPLVGDRVQYIPDNGDVLGMLEEILPRTSRLQRPPVANVDQVLMVLSTIPKPDLMLCEKVMVMTEQNHIKPIICLTKSDLSDHNEHELLRGEYAESDVHVVSAITEEGLDQLRGCFADHITVFAGQSGVGKSSLLNSLYPGIELPTGALSQRIERGRHTTRHVQLMVMPDGGMVMDTPGFSLMEIPLMDPAELADLYPEYRPYAGACRFPDCRHDEEPGCAIKEAAENGNLSTGRLARYRQLLREVDDKWRKRYNG